VRFVRMSTMATNQIVFTLGVGLLAGSIAPTPAAAAPAVPQPIEAEAFDVPLVFIPVFGDPAADFDAPLVFLDVYEGFAVVATDKTSGDDQYTFEEPVFYLPLHGSSKALGFHTMEVEAEPDMSTVLMTIPLQLTSGEVDEGWMDFDVPLAGFDVPLVGFDVPLAGFDVPLVGGVVPEELAEEVFGAPVVVLPLVSDPEAYHAAMKTGQGYTPTWLLPLDNDEDVPALMLPVL